MDKHRLYISYSRGDGSAIAERLHQALHARSFMVSRDTRKLDAFQDLSAEIERTIEANQYVLLCITPEVKNNIDQFVRREIAYSGHLNRPIIPLLFPGVSSDYEAGSLPPISFCQERSHSRMSFQKGLQALENRLTDDLQAEVQPHSQKFDPFGTYLTELYEQIIAYLETTVYALIQRASSSSRPDNVLRPLQLKFAYDVNTQDSTQEFSSFGEVFAACEQRLVLLGEPGAGKTAQLMVCAREAVIQRLHDEYAPLPVVASVETWDGKQPLIEWLAQTSGLLEDTIRQHISNKQALLLLDGLEALPSDVIHEDALESDVVDLRVEFLTALSQMVTTPTILTCRAVEYEVVKRKYRESIAFNASVTIKPLNMAQMAEFLTQHADLMPLIQADTRLQGSVSNPLFLTLLGYVYDSLGEKARLLVELSQHNLGLWKLLFYALVEKLCDHAFPDEAVPIAAVQDLLEDVAAHMYMQMWRMYATSAESVLTPYALDVLTLGEEQLALPERLGLIVRTTEGITFVSNILRDCFAFDRLVGYLTARKVEMRLGAARALGLLKDQRAISPLTIALKNERDPYVQYAIKAALDRLQPDYSIFISYRRSNWGTTFLLADRLEEKLDAVVFLDRYIDEADFEASILRHLRSANVFVLVVTKETFAPDRIHMERDWIRKEIQEALNLEIPCVLVMVDPVDLPKEEQLPKDIRAILTRQGFPLHPTAFEQNVNNITGFITTISPIKLRELNG